MEFGNDIFLRTITLADGSEWIGSAGKSSGSDVLWVWIDNGPSFLEVVTAFSNPAKTRRIIARVESSIDETSNSLEVYDGYTAFSAARIEDDKFSIRLGLE